MKYGVGIDISKGKSTISIISNEGEIIVSPFEFNHNIEGFNILNETLQNFANEEIKIIMEETGTYHLSVLNFLLKNDYFVAAENPLKIKKYLDRSLRKVKTDKKDSLKLAEYACDNWNRLIKKNSVSDIYQELKFLSRQYFNLTSVKIQQKIDFSNLCDLLFPGFYQLLSECNFISGLIIFKNYNDINKIKKMPLDAFLNNVEKLFTKKEQSRSSINLAIKIYNLAKKTVPSCSCSEYTQLIIDKCVAALILSIETTKEIITKMNELAKSTTEYNEIIKISGIGDRLAPLFIAEIGDIRRFKNAGSLIAYCGIDTPPYQSGNFTAKNIHISKRGNKYLRKIGYEAMQSIKSFCKNNSEIYNYMIKKELEGKNKKSAKIAGLNKFLRNYYGIVKKKYIEVGIW